MLDTVLIEAHYLPSLEYLGAISKSQKVILEQHEWYIKQTFRNRCYVLTTQGVQLLTVPLLNLPGKHSVGNIAIDYAQKWQNQHWRTIQSAYGKTPFFEHYADQIKALIYTQHSSLFEMNKAMLLVAIQTLGMPQEIACTTEYAQPKTIDYRGLISPKTSYSDRSFYKPLAYQQAFGQTFVPNLSFIDLLFSEGPNAMAYLLT